MVGCVGTGEKASWRTALPANVEDSLEMFTSQARIDRKTGPDDLGRLEYLQALVTEFQDTDKQGISSLFNYISRCHFANFHLKTTLQPQN